MVSELKIDINAFLKNYGIYLALAVVALIIITIVLILIFSRKHPKNKDSLVTIGEDYLKYIDALGGNDNIIAVKGMRSRLTITLKNINLINRESLALLGVNNVLATNNNVTLVMNSDVTSLVESIKKVLSL